MCHAKNYINMSIFKCVNTKTTFAVNIRITRALKYENIQMCEYKQNHRRCRYDNIQMC